jgi:hypothetical protein
MNSERTHEFGMVDKTQIMVRSPGFEPVTTTNGDIPRKIPPFSCSRKSLCGKGFLVNEGLKLERYLANG